MVNEGLASVLAVTDEENSVEVGFRGKEGFVGIPVIAGLKGSPTLVIMQVAGNRSGRRMAEPRAAGVEVESGSCVAELYTANHRYQPTTAHRTLAYVDVARRICP